LRRDRRRSAEFLATMLLIIPKLLYLARLLFWISMRTWVGALG